MSLCLTLQLETTENTCVMSASCPSSGGKCFLATFVEGQCCGDISQPPRDAVFIILSEIGLLPESPHSNILSYTACRHHISTLIQKNETRRRRALCMLPCLVSSHPHIDHSDGHHTITSHKKKIKSHRPLTTECSFEIRNRTGVVIPIGTRKYILLKSSSYLTHTKKSFN